MLVLGFNCSRASHSESPYAHDSAAAIALDGSLLAAAEEERFNRHKHTSVFPRHAIQYCLDAARATLADVDRFAFYWDPALDQANMVAADVDPLDIVNRHGFRLHVDRIVYEFFSRAFSFEVPPTRRTCVPHHVCHAASSYYCSGFDRAAFLVIDAYGEMNSISMGTIARDGHTFSVRDTVLLPTSLGVFYSSLTRLLGFWGRDDEFKVMGLAAYGDPGRFRETFRTLWNPSDTGVAYTAMPDSRRAALALAEYRRMPDEPLTSDHRDIAAALQESVEEQMLHLASRLRDRTGIDQLCLSGGVAQNSVANGRLARAGIFSRIFVQPASHDAGTALGAALYASRQSRKSCSSSTARPFSPFLGPEYSQKEVDRACASYDREICASKPRDLATAVAQDLAAGKVIGWFQGRMEFGPRALGARSILADARHEGTRDKVNTMVKHREAFRPFAPAVLADEVSRFFDVPLGIDLSLMTYTVPVLPERRRDVPAIVHHDGSARPQAVTREGNPRLWALLNAFNKITGIPLLLNTSFNVNGEPIVCTPADALECFLSTTLDGTVLGDTVVTKRNWDDPIRATSKPIVQAEVEVTTSSGVPAPGREPFRFVHLKRRHMMGQYDSLALELLFHCDGTRSVDDIARTFAEEAGDVAARAAHETLRRLTDQRIVRLL